MEVLMAVALSPDAEAVEVSALNADDLDAVAEQLDTEMARQCNDLRRLLESEQAIANRVQTVLDQCEQRAKRIRRALAALEDDAPKPQAAKVKGKGKGNWEISPEKVEEVYASIVDAIKGNGGEPVTMTTAREAKGHTGSETYAKAVAKLRDDERLRVAGRTRGGGTLLALMPDEGTRAA
jgi:hypothetical protein